MKRLRLVGGEGGEVESINMANVLMLLSRDGRSTDQSPASRVFECKTCNRQFPSFQALGGHRASHKKLRAEENGQVVEGKMKVHECSVCGLEFAIGQALGGHMRRHRATAAAVAGEKKSSGKRVLYFDLNLPPLEEKDIDQWRNVVDKVQIVDCLH